MRLPHNRHDQQISTSFRADNVAQTVVASFVLTASVTISFRADNAAQTVVVVASFVLTARLPRLAFARVTKRRLGGGKARDRNAERRA